MPNLRDYQQALVKAHRAGDTRGAEVIAKKLQEFSGGLSSDPSSGMGRGEAFLVSAGKTFSDMARGGREILGQDIGAEQAESDRLYSPVQERFPVTSFAGRAAPAVIASIPTGGSILGATGVGAALGALDPKQSAISGAAFGAGGHLAGKLLGGAPRLFNRAATKEAEKLGFKLTPGARVGSDGLLRIEESAKSTPFVGGALKAVGRKNQGRFNRIAADAIEAGKTSNLDDAALEKARNALGKGFERVIKGKQLRLDNKLLDDLATIEKGTPAQLHGRDISDAIDYVMDQVGGGEIDGRTWLAMGKQLASAARTKMRNNPEMGRAYYAVREAIDDWAERSMGGGKAIKLARKKWRDLLAVEKATDTATGNISGAKLATALEKQGRLGGQDELAQAARFARRFKPIVGDSGTATRSVVPVAGLAGALGGLDALGNLATGAAIGTGAGKLYQGLLGTPGALRTHVIPGLLKGGLIEAKPNTPIPQLTQQGLGLLQQ